MFLVRFAFGKMPRGPRCARQARQRDPGKALSHVAAPRGFSDDVRPSIRSDLKSGEGARGLLSLHNPVARAARALAGRYLCEQASRMAREGLYWFSKRAAYKEGCCFAAAGPNNVKQLICTTKVYFQIVHSYSLFYM